MTTLQRSIADTNRTSTGKRVGRPPSPDKRWKTVTVYLTASEHRTLQSRAAEQDLSLSDLGRAALME